MLRKYKLVHIIAGVALAIPMLSAPGCGGSDLPSWTGTWLTTSEGTMTLVQNGDAVSGTYSKPVGQFEGVVSGNTVIGTWTQTSSSGKCPNGPQIMMMSADGLSFTGTFHYCTLSGSSGSVNGIRQ